MPKKLYRVTTWNQPDGIGGGWARCRANLDCPTKRFAISRPDGTIIAWRRTRSEAYDVAREFNSAVNERAEFNREWRD